MSGSYTSVEGLTGEKLLAHLKTALSTDGDFPVRAKVVSELRMLANDPDAPVGKITELILREPSLGTRVLHIVNSGFYRRNRAIVTISDAVMQIGMKTLSDICAGLVILHKFIPGARRGGTFADNIKRTILCSLLSSSLAAHFKEQSAAERSYLAGTFYSMGYLLLAYYCPQLYEIAGARAAARGYDIKQSITELLGVSPAQLNLIILDALEIPSYYRDVLVESLSVPTLDAESSKLSDLAYALLAAGEISESLIMNVPKEQLEQMIIKATTAGKIRTDQFHDTLSLLPEAFTHHCQLIELGFLTLPDYITKRELFATNEQNGVAA